jgi:hypothetical protein
MLPDHNPSQSHQKERQKKPTQNALDYDVIPVLPRRQEVDWALRKEDMQVLKKRALRKIALSGTESFSTGPCKGLADLRMPSPFQKISANTRMVNTTQATVYRAEHRSRKTAKLERLWPSTKQTLYLPGPICDTRSSSRLVHCASQGPCSCR